jgi:hypothetical protein
MSSYFDTGISFINDGEDVKAQVANRPLRTLDNNLRYLWTLIKNNSLGQNLQIYRVNCRADTAVGMPVYFDTTTRVYTPALAQVSNIDEHGRVSLAESAQVWGVVSKKHSATLCDIVINGYIDLDISSVIGTETLTAGVYYLSTQTEGRLTKNKPAINIPILRSNGIGSIYVLSFVLDLLQNHNHYRFELVSAPAGIHNIPDVGERHEITFPDPDEEGWLPASHSIFEGKAPAGALFGYNWKANSILKEIWPPNPTTTAYLEIDRGLDKNIGSTGVPLGPGKVCAIDQYGIWWFSDCYGDVPWPTDYGAPLSLSASLSDACPRALQFTTTLWFSKINFSDAMFVQTVTSRDPRLKVYCAGTNTVAQAGNLELDFDFALSVAENQMGYQVIKEFNTDSGEFKRGPVVEGVYKLSNNLTISSSVSSTRTISGTPRVVHQGLIGLSVVPQENFELPVLLIRVNSAVQQFYENIPYIAFLPNLNSEIRGKLVVPYGLDLTALRLQIRVCLLGSVAGTLPSLNLTRRRLTRPPSGLTTPVTLPLNTSETTLSITTTGTLANPYEYVEATSQKFVVAPGDIVFFTLGRNSGDGYTGEVGVVHITGIISNGD